MKKVEAFIRHEAFEPIRNDLLALGFPSLSISEVKGSVFPKGITERYRGAEGNYWLRPKVKIECVVATGDVATVVDTILKHARTGAIGDGKVFVMPVEEADPDPHGRVRRGHAAGAPGRRRTRSRSQRTQGTTGLEERQRLWVGARRGQAARSWGVSSSPWPSEGCAPSGTRSVRPAASRIV